MLVNDERLLMDPTPGHIQRDVVKLREALDLENSQALYADDGHLDHKFHVGPTGRTALFFDVVPMTIIVLNSLTIGLSTDHDPDAPGWQILESFFLAFYIGECVAKLKMFGPRWYFRGLDANWNIFDFLCILLGIFDLSVYWYLQSSGQGANDSLDSIMLVKNLRMARLARMVRSLRFASELRRIFHGIISGTKVLLWAMLLLAILIYVCGILARNILANEEFPEFSSVDAAMFTIFRCVTDGCSAYNGTPVAEYLRMEYGPFFVIWYIIIYLGISMLLFNLIMAVFIENVMSNQMQRKLRELEASQNTTEVSIKEQILRIVLQTSAFGVPPEKEQEILELIPSFDSKAALVRTQFSILEGCGIVLSRTAFREMFHDRLLLRALHDADIETANSASLFDALDSDMSGWLTVQELYFGLMRLRGPVCKSEIVSMRLKLRNITEILNRQRKSLSS
mmetsp:Transcript_9257/g.16337  ORF Transcript_9257/g.16337 Transcript_9257/m.16337 type:complete len:453 (-) Transcript_9257:44-1402(-)